ncbi:hypothetical protein GALMADRAFT_917798 [Galerina marginata CBS 339.88]|uniref:Uncharacterized protein n=1 Tax=Galerina marginata (strain CBS 339.88) TaxID=685588 RepID=A0A067SHZ8_GALM3|nr:hypothetical protein GALMADRAFT_917798 [Galerina marginata CBS 339.88]
MRPRLIHRRLQPSPTQLGIEPAPWAHALVRPHAGVDSLAPALLLPSLSRPSASACSRQPELRLVATWCPPPSSPPLSLRLRLRMRTPSLPLPAQRSTTTWLGPSLIDHDD